jgi:hypothetical protein
MHVAQWHVSQIPGESLESHWGVAGNLPESRCLVLGVSYNRRLVYDHHQTM